MLWSPHSSLELAGWYQCMCVLICCLSLFFFSFFGNKTLGWSQMFFFPFISFPLSPSNGLSSPRVSPLYFQALNIFRVVLFASSPLATFSNDAAVRHGGSRFNAHCPPSCHFVPCNCRHNCQLSFLFMRAALISPSDHENLISHIPPICKTVLTNYMHFCWLLLLERPSFDLCHLLPPCVGCLHLFAVIIF